MSTPLVHKPQDKVVASVAGRLGRRFDLDTGLVRAGFVIGLFIEPGTTILVYLGLALFLPSSKGKSVGSTHMSSAEDDVRMDFGATARDACVTGGRMATVIGSVVFTISRAAIAAGRAATVAGSTAFHTHSPGHSQRRRARRQARRRTRRRGAAPSHPSRPTAPTAPTSPTLPVSPAQPAMRTARTASYAPHDAARVAPMPRMAPARRRKSAAPPKPTPKHRSTPPAERTAPSVVASSATATASPAPRTWMSDEERLEADVRAAVARTEEQARQELAATEAEAKRRRRARRGRRLRRTFGALAVTGGAIWLAGEAGIVAPGAFAIEISNQMAFAILLMAGGTWLVVSSLWRR